MGSFGSGFAAGLASGAAVGRTWRDMYEQGQLKKAIADAAESTPTVTEQASGDQALQHFQDNYVPQEGRPETAQEFLLQNPEVLAAVSKQKAGFNVGDKNFDTRSAADSAAEIAKSVGIARALEGQGLPEQAQRYRASAMRNAATQQAQDDDTELRRVLAGRQQTALRSSAGGGSGIAGESYALGTTENSQQLRADNAAHEAAVVAGKAARATGGSGAADPFDDYIKRTLPTAVQTLVKQGRLAEAGEYQKFIDTEDGKRYARDWHRGVLLHASGDSVGALKSFAKTYDDLYDDGNKIRMTPLDSGRRFRLEQIDADGNVLGQHEGETAALANDAANALSPANYVAYRLKRQAMLEREGAVADRQIEVEGIRQVGRSAHEDRVDARQQMRGNRGGLTLAQQRANAEIDAARDSVAGLDPADIRKRTQKTTDTGRENPDYDPGLARAAALAGRRKVGDDHVFDQRGQQQAQQAPAFDRKDVASRFRADKTMNSYTLGRDTPQGVEVLSGGKVVGHYR